MTRSALPQSYRVVDDNVLETFSVLGDWSTINAQTSYDDNHVLSGTHSIQVSPVDPSQGAFVTKTVSYDIGTKRCRLYFYVADPTTIKYISVYAASVSDFSRYIRADWNSAYMRPGWNSITIPSWTPVGAGSTTTATSVRLRIIIYSATGKTATVTLDSFEAGGYGRPRCIFTFDDSWSSVYTEAYPYLLARGIPGTFYVNGIRDTAEDAAPYCTLGELQEMYASGWCIANHTWNHEDLSALTLAQQQATIQADADWLIENDMPRGACHLAYPFGLRNEDTITACHNAGIKTVRTVDSAKSIWWYQTEADPLMYHFDLQFNFHTGNLSVGSMNTFKAGVENAIRLGGTIVFLAHQILETVDEGESLPETTIAYFQEAVDFIVSKKIKCVTIDEWYEGLTNPRYQSLPVGRA